MFDFKLNFYGYKKGTRALVRIPSTRLSSAKAFHVFVKTTSNSNWERLTDNIIEIPYQIKINSDKLDYIDSVLEFYSIQLQNEIEKELKKLRDKNKKKPSKKKVTKKKVTKKKPSTKKVTKKKVTKKKPSKKKVTKRKQVVKEKEVYTPQKIIKDAGIVEEFLPNEPLRVPNLPEKPRLTLTKKQFNAQMSRIIFDELDGRNLTWPAQRIDNFIDKLWRAYKKSSHLIANEDFRRMLVIKELTRPKNEKEKELRKKKFEDFKEQIENKEVNFTSDVGADVTLQVKEVFDMRDMRKKGEQTREILEDGFLKEVDRQKGFAQMIVDYDENITVDKADLTGQQIFTTVAFDKVRSDVEQLFNEAVQKGFYDEDEDAEYSIRLLLPIVDEENKVPSSYVRELGGDKEFGFGFSTTRRPITGPDDFDALLDELFTSAKTSMNRYVKLNNGIGFMISGFTIERLIK